MNMKISKSTLLVALMLGVGACGRSQGTNNDAVSTSAVDTNAVKAAANPFADAEAKMNKAMVLAVGANAGDTWARKMIAHHQGAIDMSEIMLHQNPKPDVAMMARENIETQKEDIAALRRLLRSGPPDHYSADLYRSPMVDMKQKMDMVTGSDANELFMRMMLEHHKGAIAMSDVALRQQHGVTGAMKSQIEKTKAENQRDAAMVDAMLNGKSIMPSRA